MQLFSLLDWIDLCYSHGYLSDLSSAFKPGLGLPNLTMARPSRVLVESHLLLLFFLFFRSLFAIVLWLLEGLGDEGGGKGGHRHLSLAVWVGDLWRWCGGPSSSWLPMLVMLHVHHLRWIELRRHDCGKPFCFCSYSHCLGEKLLLLQSGFVRGWRRKTVPSDLLIWVPSF